MAEKILITGATGNIGYEVAKQMTSRGEPVHVALRSEKSGANRFGQAELVTHELEQLLGRKPITFEQYVEDYADVWRR